MEWASTESSIPESAVIIYLDTVLNTMWNLSVVALKTEYQSQILRENWVL